jgi:hypothetical protein
LPSRRANVDFHFYANRIEEQPIVDMHTHLYPPVFGTPVPNASGRVDPNGLLLWGIDELVTYHYLVAEVYRYVPATKLPYEQFWRMTKRQQADHIWKHCFVENTPLSEACRGVLTTLQPLGWTPTKNRSTPIAGYFDSRTPAQYIDRVMELSNVSSITMTNPVFDDNERNRWLAGIKPDPRFKAVLRIDPLLRNWPVAPKKLPNGAIASARRFRNRPSRKSADSCANGSTGRRRSIWPSVLPPEFRYPAEASDQSRSARGRRFWRKSFFPSAPSADCRLP